MSRFRRSSFASTPGGRVLLYLVIAAAHAVLLFGPLLLLDALNKRTPKENTFRVKIGAAELSKGPDVGMPERKPPVPPVPPAPEPKVPAVKPKPEPKVPVVKPKPVPPKPKPVPAKPKPKPKPKNKPVPQKPRPVVKPKPEPKVPVVKPKPKPVKPVVKPRKKPVKPVVKPKPKTNPMDGVYQDNSKPNMNPKVPVGTRDRSQKYAPKADHKDPGGGRKVDEAQFVRYGKNVENYIYSRWAEPPRALLRGEFPETVVEITIEANGKVSSAKIVRASGNVSMEESVKALLSQLDLLPRPPDGRISFRITLKTR